MQVSKGVHHYKSPSVGRLVIEENSWTQKEKVRWWAGRSQGDWKNQGRLPAFASRQSHYTISIPFVGSICAKNAHVQFWLLSFCKQLDFEVLIICGFEILTTCDFDYLRFWNFEEWKAGSDVYKKYRHSKVTPRVRRLQYLTPQEPPSPWVTPPRGGGK